MARYRGKWKTASMPTSPRTATRTISRKPFARSRKSTHVSANRNTIGLCTQSRRETNQCRRDPTYLKIHASLSDSMPLFRIIARHRGKWKTASIPSLSTHGNPRYVMPTFRASTEELLTLQSTAKMTPNHNASGPCTLVA